MQKNIWTKYYIIVGVIIVLLFSVYLIKRIKPNLKTTQQSSNISNEIIHVDETSSISNPTTSVTSNPTTSVTSNPTTSVTSNPTTSVTSNPTTSVTSNPTTSVTSNPTTSVTTSPPTPCELNDWSEWGPCSSKTNGTQTRTRSIKKNATGSFTCPPDNSPERLETQSCQECRVTPILLSSPPYASEIDIPLVYTYIPDIKMRKYRPEQYISQSPRGTGDFTKCPEPKEITEKTPCILKNWSDWSSCYNNKKSRVRGVKYDAHPDLPQCPPYNSIMRFEVVQCDSGNVSPQAGNVPPRGGEYQPQGGGEYQPQGGNVQSRQQGQSLDPSDPNLPPELRDRLVQEQNAENCRLLDWGKWTYNTQTRTRTRTRTTAGNPSDCKTPLILEETEKTPCILEDDWTKSGVCLDTCEQVFTRGVQYDPHPELPQCPSSSSSERFMKKPCEPSECECKFGTWSNWSVWGSCDNDCRKSRYRTRTAGGTKGSYTCPPNSDIEYESTDCNCPCEYTTSEWSKSGCNLVRTNTITRQGKGTYANTTCVSPTETKPCDTTCKPSSPTNVSYSFYYRDISLIEPYLTVKATYTPPNTNLPDYYGYQIMRGTAIDPTIYNVDSSFSNAISNYLTIYPPLNDGSFSGKIRIVPMSNCNGVPSGDPSPWSQQIDVSPFNSIDGICYNGAENCKKFSKTSSSCLADNGFTYRDKCKTFVNTNFSNYIGTYVSGQNTGKELEITFNGVSGQIKNVKGQYTRFYPAEGVTLNNVSYSGKTYNFTLSIGSEEDKYYQGSVDTNFDEKRIQFYPPSSQNPKPSVFVQFIGTVFDKK